MSSSTFGTQLDNSPTDGVTALRFSNTNDLLLASSWDGLARLYDAAQTQLRGSYAHQAPVLDATFHGDSESVVYTAGLDGQIKRYDFVSRVESPVGAHEAPVRCCEFLRERSILVTGGWDSTLRVWDSRAPQGQNCMAVLPLPGKVYTLAASSTRLVVGTSGRHVLIYDIRNLEAGRPEQTRESSLKYQTRCIRCYPDGTGYALSSVEGRVAMEYFDNSVEVQAKKYAFKCHRKSEGGRDTVFPINAIAFHQAYGTFATGGCDGVVNIWDGKNQKRVFQIPNYPTSIAALAFNPAGSLLAVAASYTFEKGEVDHPPDSIYIRKMQDVEVRPRQKKA